MILQVTDALASFEPFKGYDQFPPLRALSSSTFVGDGGTVVSGNLGNLSLYPGIPTSARLLGVFAGTDQFKPGRFGVPLTLEMAVGENGTILSREESPWSTMTTPTTKTLRSIAGGSNTSDVWAVGDDGEIIHYDGHSWSSGWRPPTPGVNLRAVSNGWVVGDNGVAFELSQSGTVDHPTGSPVNLNAVAVYPGSITPPISRPVVAAGDGGVVLVWTGLKWQALPSPSMAPLYAACFVSNNGSSNGLIVGGSDGAFSISWPPDGATWSRIGVNMGNRSSNPRALETAKGDIWAAYSTNVEPALSRIIRIQGGVATTVSLFTLDPIQRFVEVPGGSIWASTKNGYFRWDGQSFVQQSTDAGATVSGTANDELWFKNGRPGADGPASLRAIDDIWTIPLAHWNGTTWTTPVLPMPSVDPGTLLQVRTAADGVWILGQFAVLKWNGTDLQVIAKAADNPAGSLFRDFWPIAANDIWVSDGSVYVYHWDGKSFTRLLGDGSTFTGGSDHAWRIGTDRLVLLPQ